MGQYYEFVDVDKKELIKPHALDCGAKLIEFANKNSACSLALLNKLAGDWKGDRVYVVGDYASSWECVEDSYNSTLRQTLQELGATDLYTFADENFNNVSAQCDTSDNGYRFVYNHATQQMIDLNDYSLDWQWFDTRTGQGGADIIAPLNLLLAMGNGRGGGDFHGRGKELVGSWCNTVQHIEVRKDAIPECNYQKLSPKFRWNKGDDDETSNGYRYGDLRVWLAEHEQELLAKRDAGQVDALWFIKVRPEELAKQKN